MGKSTFVSRGLLIGVMTSGLLALTVVGMALSTGADDSMAQAAVRTTPSSMVAQPNVDSPNGEDGHPPRELPHKARSAAERESALILTIPSLTSMPTIPPVETYIPETRELPVTGEGLPGVPTVPPVMASPTVEASPTLTPTATATPDGSEVEGGKRRLALLGGLGLAVLCGGGIVVGGVLFFVLRRQGKRAAAGDGVPSPGLEGRPVLIVPSIDPIVLRSGVTTIGRSEENDIIIEDHQTSRQHARIECAGGVCTFEDLQSSNGSFVNGERVSRAVLTSGNRLRIGDVEMTYRAPEVQAPGAWLEVGGERHAVPAGGLTMGRSGDNEIRLADPVASRRHARVELRQGTYMLIDLDSANGTFVNGQRVQQHALRDGDEIRIGSTRITTEVTN